MRDTVFKPNALTLEQIDDLEDWQLLCAAAHYGPTMGDCRSLDYGYSIRFGVGDPETGTLICDGVDLTDDIEMTDPMAALFKYALREKSWHALARGVLREWLEEE